nr:MAG TPA: hypothetical protein [Caudoviricetes sp.]
MIVYCYFFLWFINCWHCCIVVLCCIVSMYSPLQVKDVKCEGISKQKYYLPIPTLK